MIHFNKKERVISRRKKKRNKALVKKYPWLLPRNVWTDKIPEDYDYTYTELDSLSRGWRIAFGDMICKEVDAELKRTGRRDTYRIQELKSKYGSMRWYDNGGSDQLRQIIDKYEYLSENICESCGRPDVPQTNGGWIEPICFDCFVKRVRRSEQYQAKYLQHDIPPKTLEEIKEWYEKSVEENARMGDTYTIRRFSTDGSVDTTYDVTETANKIREAWNKKQERRLRKREKRH